MSTKDIIPSIRSKKSPRVADNENARTDEEGTIHEKKNDKNSDAKDGKTLPTKKSKHQKQEKNDNTRGDEEATIHERTEEKKSDAQSGSILTASKSIKKLQDSSNSAKQYRAQRPQQLQPKQSIPATPRIPTSKEQLKTAYEYFQPSHPIPRQQPREQQRSDPTQRSIASLSPSLQQKQQPKEKPKNSVSPPQPISPSVSPSAKRSLKKNVTSGSYMKVDSAYKRATTPGSRSRSNTTRDVASLDTAISDASFNRSTKTNNVWDEKK